GPRDGLADGGVVLARRRGAAAGPDLHGYRPTVAARAVERDGGLAGILVDGVAGGVERHDAGVIGGGVVLHDGQHGRGLCAQGRAGRGGQGQVDRRVPVVEVVVVHGDGDQPGTTVAIGPRNGLADGGVVQAGGGRAVARAHQHGGGAAAAAGARHRD